DLGKLLWGHILEVRFPVSTGIDADDLHEACSFIMTVFLGRGFTPCVGRGRMGAAQGATPTCEGPWRSRVRPCRMVCARSWPGKALAAVRAARHPAPPTPLYPSGEKTQAPRAGTHGRDAPWQHGGPGPRVTALCGTWCMRRPGGLVRGERLAPGGATRNGP